MRVIRRTEERLEFVYREKEKERMIKGMKRERKRARVGRID